VPDRCSWSFAVGSGLRSWGRDSKSCCSIDDTAIIERLVESGQSPLSRCDADYAEFTTRERWKDAVGELLIPEYREEKQQWEAIEDRRDFAVTTIIIAALIKDEPEVLDPVPDDKILEARGIYLSLAELGKISGPLVDAVRDSEITFSRPC
jgi:hypothetical protein